MASRILIIHAISGLDAIQGIKGRNKQIIKLVLCELKMVDK